MARCQFRKASAACAGTCCTITEDARAPRTCRGAPAALEGKGFMQTVRQRGPGFSPTGLRGSWLRTCLELLQDVDGLPERQPGQGQPALLRRQGQLPPEKPVVIAAVLQRVLHGRAVVDALDPGPVGGCHAHGTGITDRVQGTA